MVNEANGIFELHDRVVSKYLGSLRASSKISEIYFDFGDSLAFQYTSDGVLCSIFLLSFQLHILMITRGTKF